VPISSVAPSQEGVFLCLAPDFQLGLSPFSSFAAGGGSADNIVMKTLHKKWVKPIDKPILINYIIDIETLTTEIYYG